MGIYQTDSWFTCIENQIVNIYCKLNSDDDRLLPCCTSTVTVTKLKYILQHTYTKFLQSEPIQQHADNKKGAPLSIKEILILEGCVAVSCANNHLRSPSMLLGSLKIIWPTFNWPGGVEEMRWESMGAPTSQESGDAQTHSVALWSWSWAFSSHRFHTLYFSCSL